jgi:hypothetical protein
MNEWDLKKKKGYLNIHVMRANRGLEVQLHPHLTWAVDGSDW